MASSIERLNLNLAASLPAVSEARAEGYKQAFQENRQRVYALAFWMTDNEVAAEELMISAFCRAFATSADPGAELIDRSLLAELRQLMSIGELSLQCAPATVVSNVRRNTLRVHLERAVVQVPPTERLIFLLHDVEGYDHARIARIVGLRENDCRAGLHQARLRIRELLAAMRD